MKEFCTILLLLLLLSSMCIPAFADVYIEYCPHCESNTFWYDGCSWVSAGNTTYGHHVASNDMVCNTYIHMKYNGRVCRSCGNIYAFSMKHSHTWYHTICVDQLWCPYLTGSGDDNNRIIHIGYLGM